MNKGLLFLVLAIGLAFSVACGKFQSQKTQYGTTSIQVVPPQVHILPVNEDLVRTQPAQSAPVEIIELTELNTVVMDQAFDDESVSQVMLELHALSTKVPKNTTVYLVLNSPGGSVVAGLKLITFIKGLPLNVKTISIFSASMAFQTVQNLGERLVLPDSTLMSHRAKFGVSGEAPGEMFSNLKFIMTIIDSLDYTASKRMNISFDEYRKMVADEYWSWGANSVNDNSADRVILAKCNPNLMTTKMQKVNTIFGIFEVETSKCPLIPGVLSIKGADERSISEDGQTITYKKKSVTPEQLEYVKMLFTDKKQFVEKYILSGKLK